MRRGGGLLPVSELVQPRPGDRVENVRVRFRTVGDASCTGAVESGATTLEEVIAERARQLGSEFSMRRLFDEVNGVGMIPVSLIYWELTGDDRMIRELRDGAGPLVKWLEGVLEEKNPQPQSVEYGFLSLAYIGNDDKASLEFVLDYATKGKHPDNTVAANAIKACYQWRELDAKTRKEFFDKICMFLEGLHSGMTGGDPKRRGTYETRYKAVEADGKDALRELGDGTTNWDEPRKARAWFNENKKQKWEKYTGPHFRKAPAAPAGDTKEKEKDGGDAKPEG